MSELKDQLAKEFPKTSEEILKVFAGETVEEVKTGTTTDAKDAEIAEVAEEAVETSTEEVSAIEKQAMDLGWDKTGEKAKAAGKRILSAEEYVDRQSLYNKIDSQKHELTDLKKSLTTALETFKKSEEIAYQKALTELTKQREAAIKDGDLKSTYALDNQLTEVYKRRAEVERMTPPAPDRVTNELPPEAKEFGERNKSWLDPRKPENRPVIAFAQTIENNIREADPTISNKELFEKIDKEVRTTFHSRFANPERDKAPAVTIKKEAATTSGKVGMASKLTPEQKLLGQSFVKLKTYKNLEEFAQDLHSKGVLK
jgi:hypothetical protein